MPSRKTRFGTRRKSKPKSSNANAQDTNPQDFAPHFPSLPPLPINWPYCWVEGNDNHDMNEEATSKGNADVDARMLEEEESKKQGSEEPKKQEKEEDDQNINKQKKSKKHGKHQQKEKRRSRDERESESEHDHDGSTEAQSAMEIEIARTKEPNCEDICMDHDDEVGGREAETTESGTALNTNNSAKPQNHDDALLKDSSDNIAGLSFSSSNEDDVAMSVHYSLDARATTPTASDEDSDIQTYAQALAKAQTETPTNRGSKLDWLTLHITDYDPEELDKPMGDFQLRRGSPLVQILHKYSYQQDVPLSDMRFVYGPWVLEDTDTAYELGIPDGAVIEVFYRRSVVERTHKQNAKDLVKEDRKSADRNGFWNKGDNTIDANTAFLPSTSSVLSQPAFLPVESKPIQAPLSLEQQIEALSISNTTRNEVLTQLPSQKTQESPNSKLVFKSLLLPPPDSVVQQTEPQIKAATRAQVQTKPMLPTFTPQVSTPDPSAREMTASTNPVQTEKAQFKMTVMLEPTPEPFTLPVETPREMTPAPTQNDHLQPPVPTILAPPPTPAHGKGSKSRTQRVGARELRDILESISVIQGSRFRPRRSRETSCASFADTSTVGSSPAPTFSKVVPAASAPSPLTTVENTNTETRRAKQKSQKKEKSKGKGKGKKKNDQSKKENVALHGVKKGRVKKGRVAKS